jgi:filamentous hemagglutinin
MQITPSGRYDFVTMPSNMIWVARSNDNFDFSTHLGLSLGMDVKFAGSIRFANNMGPKRGTIIHWKNDSGHYQPPATMAYNAGLPLGLFLEY